MDQGQLYGSGSLDARREEAYRKIKSKLRPSVIDESLLPTPRVASWDERSSPKQVAAYEAWAWYQAMLYWIPGRVGWLVRRALYKPFFQRAGEGWHVAEYAIIQRVQYFQIGHKCAIGRFCTINAQGGVIIGDYSGMGPFVTILSTSHNFYKQKYSGGLPYGAQPRIMETAPVILSSNVWIGAGSTILSGVRIGENSIVAAGSLVNKDVPDYTMVAGVPARVVWKRSLEDYESTPGEFVLPSLFDKMRKKESQGE